MQGGRGASSHSRVLLQLVQRAGLGSCRPASMCCSRGEGLPESCCCADHTMSTGYSCICGVQPSPVPATMASRSLHQLTPLGLAVLWPQAHTCQTEALQPGSMRQQQDPLRPSIRQPSISGLPASPFPGREQQGGPALPSCFTPQCRHCWERGKVSGQGWLAVSNRGRQAAYGQHQGTGKGFQTAWQGGSCHAELHRHQHGTCHRPKCASRAVLETCPSVQATRATTQPLRAPAPCTACTGTPSKGQCTCWYCTKLRCKNSMSF